RVKASAVGLDAEEYRAELAVDSGWTGMDTLEVTDAEMSALYETGRLEHDAARELLVHTGLTVLGPSGSALGRVTPDHAVRLVRGDRDAFGRHGPPVRGPSGSARGRVTPAPAGRLVRGDRAACGLHGRPAEQGIALDPLLDPAGGMAGLGGRAGPGRGALALCAGLGAVLER